MCSGIDNKSSVILEFEGRKVFIGPVEKDVLRSDPDPFAIWAGRLESTPILFECYLIGFLGQSEWSSLSPKQKNSLSLLLVLCFHASFELLL